MAHGVVTVGDLMTTALVTVKEDQAIDRADADMRLAGIRHLPVVDSRNRLVGILSNRDLYRALARGRMAVAIRDVMTTAVRTVTPETSAAAAAEILATEKIGALPVVGEDGQLVGLVSETDFLRLVRELLSD